MLTRYNKGDLLAVPVIDDKVAVAQIVEPLGGNVLVAVYPDLVDPGLVDPGLVYPELAEALPLDEPFLLAETMDLRIRNGTWPIVGNRAVPGSIALPEFKVWVEPPGGFRTQDIHGTVGSTALTAAQASRMKSQTSYSPAVIEHAVRAYHGHGPWLAAFEGLVA